MGFAVMVRRYFAKAVLIPRGGPHCAYRCVLLDLDYLRQEKHQVRNFMSSIIAIGSPSAFYLSVRSFNVQDTEFSDVQEHSQTIRKVMFSLRLVMMEAIVAARTIRLAAMKI